MIKVTKKLLATAFLGVAVATSLGSFVGANTHVYVGQNVGVQWGNVGGVELVGDPGFFKCDGQC